MRLGRDARQDAHATGRRDHAADRVKAAHLDAQAHRSPQTTAFVGQTGSQRRGRRQAHVVVGQGVRKRHLRLRSQGVALRHDHHQFVEPVGIGRQAVGGRTVSEYADIGAVFKHGGDDVAAVLLFQVDAHGRVAIHEGGQVFGQELRQRRGIGGNAHLPAHALREIRQRARHLLHFLQYAQCVDQAGLAGVGQFHPGGVAVQQRGAQGGL
ncbi:hypothetical protein D3C72_1670970 [compost metagenome]